MIVMRGDIVEIMSSLQGKLIQSAIEEIKGRGDGMEGMYQVSDQIGVPALIGSMAEEQGKGCMNLCLPFSWCIS